VTDGPMSSPHFVQFGPCTPRTSHDNISPAENGLEIYLFVQLSVTQAFSESNRDPEVVWVATLTAWQEVFGQYPIFMSYAPIIPFEFKR